MSAIVIHGFGGRIPRMASQLLPTNAATLASNIKTFGKSLSSWRRSTLVNSPLVTAIRSIYRMYNGSTDYWLAFSSRVNVVKSPGAVDFRLFYTGDATPRKTTLALATSGTPYPFDHREMGLPAPAAPVVAINAAGVAPNSARNYIATFVNDLDEEGPPSPASNSITFGATGFTIDITGLDTGKRAVASVTRVGTTATANAAAHGFYDGSKVTIAGAAQAEYNGTFVIDLIDADHFTYQVSGAPVTPATGVITAVGNYGLTKLRIYRSLVSSAGTVGYQLVKEHLLSAGTTDSDTVLDSALGVICPTFEMAGNVVIDGSQFVQPPADLHHIMLHPGNFAVGISGNQLVCSEPGKLWAWPLRYRIALDYDGMGLGIVGNTIVVATKGKAYKVTGSHPLFLSKDTDEGSEPCSSGDGVASLPFGVLYPTPNGIQLVGVAETISALEPWAKRDQWLRQYFPGTIFASIYQGAYFGFYDDGSRVRGFVFDRTNDLGPFTDLDYDVSALYADPETAKLYYVNSDDILEWEGDQLNLSPFDWTGKEFVLPHDTNLAVAQIDADWAALAGDFAAAEAQQVVDQAYNASLLAGDAMAAIPARANATVYGVGQTVKLLERHLVCTVGGTSGGGAPSLVGKVLGDNVNDNTVTWKMIWQVQSVDRSGLNEGELNEFTLNGGLLHDTLWADYDNRSLLFQLYADGVLKHSQNVTSGDAFKLPSGYLSHLYKPRLSGNIDVFGLKIAENMQELRTLNG